MQRNANSYHMQQHNLDLGDGKGSGDDIWALWYWVREADEVGRGERWWSTVCGKSAGSSKPVAYQAQVLRFELTAVEREESLLSKYFCFILSN